MLLNRASRLRCDVDRRGYVIASLCLSVSMSTGLPTTFRRMDFLVKFGEVAKVSTWLGSEALY